MACTGGLHGTEKQTGKPITIDSWAREVHYLVKEEGAWRFLGNTGGVSPLGFTSKRSPSSSFLGGCSKRPSSKAAASNSIVLPSLLVDFVQDGLDESPTARNVFTRPPTGTPSRAMSPGEGLPIFPTSPSGEQPDCPSLRASDEHCFIVRVLRARRMVWLFPSCSSETACCASTRDLPGHPFPC